MANERPYAGLIEQLRGAGLRPTRQRLALARLLFEHGNRHVTAEELHDEAMKAQVRVSLATVYNTLHQFTAAGLLRQVMVDAGRAYFDTNTAHHHHFLHTDTGLIEDIDHASVVIAGLPDAPDGATIDRVDVVVRLNKYTQ